MNIENDLPDKDGGNDGYNNGGIVKGKKNSYSKTWLWGKNIYFEWEKADLLQHKLC
jgi:hypothetical protein